MDFGIDGITAAIIIMCVTGAVECVKHLFNKDWYKAIVVLVSAVIGGLVGALSGISILPGIALGLAASGIITVANKIGER